MRHASLFTWSAEYGDDGYCNVCHGADIRREQRIGKERQVELREAQKHLKMLESKRVMPGMFSGDGAPDERSRQCQECGDFYDVARFKGHYNKVFTVCAKCRSKESSREANRKRRAANKQAILFARDAVKKRSDMQLDELKRDELRALKTAGAQYVRRYKQCKEEGSGVEALQRNLNHVRYYKYLMDWMEEEHGKGNIHGSAYYMTDSLAMEQFGLA